MVSSNSTYGLLFLHKNFIFKKISVISRTGRTVAKRGELVDQNFERGDLVLKGVYEAGGTPLSFINRRFIFR